MLNVVILADTERYKELNSSFGNHVILEIISYVLHLHLNASEIFFSNSYYVAMAQLTES